jgi:hypothetical protein
MASGGRNRLANLLGRGSGKLLEIVLFTRHAKKIQKQHYIPEFYQKRWAGPDRRLCEYTVRHKDVVSRGASAALTNMLLPDPLPWNTRLKSEWIRFLMSLLHRSPERVAYLKAIVEAEYRD